MNRILVAFLILFAFNASAGQPIYGLKVFDTHPFQCSVDALFGRSDSRQWSPAQAGIYRPIYVKRIAVWVGAAVGFRGDIAHSLTVDDNLISSDGWDHYAEPNGANGGLREIDWHGDYVKFAPYEALTFAWSCAGFAHGGPAHWQVTIWFTFSP